MCELYAISVVTKQILRSATSGLGLHCLPMSKNVRHIWAKAYCKLHDALLYDVPVASNIKKYVNAQATNSALGEPVHLRCPAWARFVRLHRRGSFALAM